MSTGWVVGLLVVLLAASLSAAAEPRVFAARDFGALPDAPGDSGEALRRAVAAAIASGPGAEVVLEAGTYHVGAPAERVECLAIANATGFTLRGAGFATKLVITSPMSGAISVFGGRDVTLRGFTLDYDPLPFCQGIVRAVDVPGGSFDLEIAPGYTTPDAPNFIHAAEPYGKWGMILDPATRSIRAGTPDHYMTPRWEHRDGRVWRFFTAAEHYRRNLALMRVGDSYVHLARGFGSAVFAQQTEGIQLENIRIHASPGLAVGIVGCSGHAVVRGLEVVFPAGGDRLLTTNADGIHGQQNRIGPVIERCTFEGMADDAINLYAPPNILHEVHSATDWLVSGGCRIVAGDRLQVFDPRTGAVRGQVVAATVTPEQGQLRLTLAQPFDGAQPGADQRTADTLYNLSACGAGFRIVGNTMRGHRRYGCMLRAGAGLVEGNTFQDTTGAGVAVLNEPDWPEGPVPWDITIRGNHFLRGGTCQGYADSPQGAALTVKAVRLGFALAAGRPLHGVVIEDNDFTDCLGAAVYVGAADGLVVRRNRVTASAQAPLAHKTAAFVLGDSVGVVLSGNHVTDPRAGTTAAVAIGADVAPGEAGVRISDLIASLAPGVPAVDDQRPKP